LHPFDLPTLIGGLVQLPVFGMLYSSIRSSLSSSTAFLWIRESGRARFLPDAGDTFLTGLTAYLMPSAPAQMRSTWSSSSDIHILIVWKLAAGLGLYWVTSSGVSLFQTVWLRIVARLRQEWADNFVASSLVYEAR